MLLTTHEVETIWRNNRVKQQAYYYHKYTFFLSFWFPAHLKTLKIFISLEAKNISLLKDQQQVPKKNQKTNKQTKAVFSIQGTKSPTYLGKSDTLTG